MKEMEHEDVKPLTHQYSGALHDCKVRLYRQNVAQTSWLIDRQHAQS